MSLDLSEEERAFLLRLVEAEIASNRFPLAPRVEVLRRLQAKLGKERPDRAPERPRRSRTRIES
jgi:hypothetical protein